jgi:hypothetical protein
MTRTELRDIARRRGIVQWFKSRKIERLRLAASGDILAKRCTPGSREHPLRDIPGQTEYFCVELDPAQSVTLGDLLK